MTDLPFAKKHYGPQNFPSMTEFTKPKPIDPNHVKTWKER